MSAMLKGVALLIVGGGLSTGGWYLNNYIDKEPMAYSVAYAEEKFNEGYADKALGGLTSNKPKLVANIEANKAWFDWVFRNRLSVKKTSNESSNIESDFNSVEKGYSNSKDTADSAKALNKVCEAQYAKKNNDYSNNDNKRKNSVQWFCTPGGNKTIDIPAA